MDTLNIQQSISNEFPLLSEFIIGVALIIANLLGTKTYGYIQNVPLNFFWQLKYKPVLKLSPNWDLEELKKRLKIIVIDDVNTFPIEQFKDYGYNIDYWDKVKEIKKLEDGFYDIIILDIGDVAKEISEDDGFGVMERLKSHNPAQIIIAYSGQNFDFSKQRFWELADEKIAKPSLFLKTEKVVNNIIEKKLNITHYFNVLKTNLIKANIPERSIKKYETILYCSIKNRKEPHWEKSLSFAEHDRALFAQTKAISKTILKYFQK